MPLPNDALLRKVSPLTLVAILIGCTTTPPATESGLPSGFPHYETRLEGERQHTIDYFGDSIKYGNTDMSISEVLASEFGETVSTVERPFYYFLMKPNGPFPAFAPKDRQQHQFREGNYECSSRPEGAKTFYRCRGSTGTSFEAVYDEKFGVESFDWYCAGSSFNTCRYYLKGEKGMLAKQDLGLR